MNWLQLLGTCVDFFAREVICFSPSCERRSINFIIQSLYESNENLETRAEAWKRQAAETLNLSLIPVEPLKAAHQMFIQVTWQEQRSM